MIPGMKLTPEQERLTRLHAKAAKAHEDLAERSLAAALASLRGGVPPMMAANASPFTASYIRRMARRAGIEGDPKYDRTGGR